MSRKRRNAMTLFIIIALALFFAMLSLTPLFVNDNDCLVLLPE
jgi:hypothetical protein